MKDYNEQRYTVSINVRVTLGDMTWTDAIKGLNVGHALYLARLNWPTAIIEVIK